MHKGSHDEQVKAELQAAVLAAAPHLLTPRAGTESAVDPFELAHRYTAGDTMAGLAREHGYGVTTMRAILVAGGATIRKPILAGGGRRRPVRLRVPGNVDPRAVSAAVARQLGQDVDDW